MNLNKKCYNASLRNVYSGRDVDLITYICCVTPVVGTNGRRDKVERHDGQ